MRHIAQVQQTRQGNHNTLHPKLNKKCVYCLGAKILFYAKKIKPFGVKRRIFGVNGSEKCFYLSLRGFLRVSTKASDPLLRALIVIAILPRG